MISDDADANADFLDDVVGGGRTIGTAMTAKEQLLRAIDDLSEAEAADLLQVLSNTRDLDGEADAHP